MVLRDVAAQLHQVMEETTPAVFGDGSKLLLDVEGEKSTKGSTDFTRLQPAKPF